MPHKVTLYTDGAASGNPGNGGYGVVLISGTHRKEIAKGYRLTTNNRMELMAVIAGLEALKKSPCEVTVFTDSRYVADAVNKGWLFGWERKGFTGKKNPDLWKRFLVAYRRHKVLFNWIRGHSEIAENERCDRLAVEASRQSELEEDTGYVKPEEDGIFR